MAFQGLTLMASISLILNTQVPCHHSCSHLLVRTSGKFASLLIHLLPTSLFLSYVILHLLGVYKNVDPIQLYENQIQRVHCLVDQTCLMKHPKIMASFASCLSPNCARTIFSHLSHSCSSSISLSSVSVCPRITSNRRGSEKINNIYPGERSHSRYW